MASWLDRIRSHEGEYILASSGRTVSVVETALREAGSPVEVSEKLGVEAADLIAAIAFLGLGPDDSPGPALVQSKPVRPWLRTGIEDRSLAPLFPGSREPDRLALSAGLLQIHDFWEASHHAAQRADDLGEASTAAYWHGIAHRREPDPSNAAYWFRRVGPHPVFIPLAKASAEVAGDQGEASRFLGKDGRWNPMAFIDACASGRHEAMLRLIQRLEMALLLDASLSRLGR